LEAEDKLKGTMRIIRTLGLALALPLENHAQQLFPGSAARWSPDELLIPRVFGFDRTGSAQEVLSLPLSTSPGPGLNDHFRAAPIRFEGNEGQVDSESKFLARGPGYHLFLTQTQAVMVFNEPKGAHARLACRVWRTRIVDPGFGGLLKPICYQQL
jgi:hypothetical protein